MNIETNEQKIALADQLASFQKTELYQSLIGPVIDEIAGLQHAYKLKATEAQRFDGYFDGLNKVIQVMHQIETEAETARAEIKAEQERQARNKPPEDSSEL